MRGNTVQVFNPGPNQQHAICLSISSDPLAVRNGLADLFDDYAMSCLSDDVRGTAEIVLAEVLNNIVEHAYACYPGEIEIRVQIRAQDLQFNIIDAGLAMPDDQLPLGQLRDLGAADDLPEGGFGWFLIRTLSRDLSYVRSGRQNQLSFRLETNQSSQ